MYKEDTSHAHGPNPKRYARAYKKMMSIGASLDLLNESLVSKVNARKIKPKWWVRGRGRGVAPKKVGSTSSVLTLY